MSKKKRVPSSSLPGKSVAKAPAASPAKKNSSLILIAGIAVLSLVLLGILWGCTSSQQAPTPTPIPATATPEPPRNTPTTAAAAVEPVAGMPQNPYERADMYTQAPEMTIDPAKTYIATINTAKGDIVIELNAAVAPLTVNNFVFLSRAGFYNGLTFHRVEPGFVIQGGDPLGTGTGGPGYNVSAEIQLPHDEGVIAMARQGDEVNPKRESSGSQFYITLAPANFLDGAYTAFGKVTSGMEIVKSIAIGDVINSITITEK